MDKDFKEYYKETFEEEVLTTDQRYNEYVMTSLRTIWGCDINLVRHEFGVKYSRHLLQESKKHTSSGQLDLRDNRLFLSTRGKLFADGIASDLFI